MEKTTCCLCSSLIARSRTFLVAGGQAGEDGDDAEEARFTAILHGVHGDEEGRQPATEGLNANLQVVVARAHGGRDQVLILETSRGGILTNEIVLLNSVGTADCQVFGCHGHAVFESEGDIANAVPHGVDFQQLTVGREALHLFLPESSFPRAIVQAEWSKREMKL